METRKTVEEELSLHIGKLTIDKCIAEQERNYLKLELLALFKVLKDLQEKEQLKLTVEEVLNSEFSSYNNFIDSIKKS